MIQQFQDKILGFHRIFATVGNPGIEQCAVVQGILYNTHRFTMAECRDLSVTLLAAIDIINGRTTEASNAAITSGEPKGA